MPVDSAVIPTDIEIDATDIYFADWGGGGTGSNPPDQPGLKKIAKP